MEYKNILITQDSGIVTITMNRPKVLNAFNEETLRELAAALDELDNEQTKVIIITGAGEKAFVAGADVAAMSQMDVEQARSFAQFGHQVMSRIENYPRPVIAAVNGYALGGGCELALACDIRIASDTAQFGLPEINLGIMCGWGATQRLPQLIGAGRAREMIYSGDIINAAQAEKIGLVNRVVPPGELTATVEKFAQKLAGKPAVALSLVKKSINQASQIQQSQRLELEIDCFSKCFATADQDEGMDAFLNKRQPVFQGK